MAREEIGEIRLSGHDDASGNGFMIHVGYNMTMNEDDVANVSSAFILRVPKRLRNFNDSFYSPQLVSIGPFHYGKKELREMEKSKSEAVRRMQKRIQRRDPHASIKSIVEEGIAVKDKEIRGFYGEVITGIDPIELAWMVTRDACFIFELLINNGGRCDPSNQLFKDEVTAYSWIYDPVFHAALQNPTTRQLWDDIFLFENQIPLWILQHLLQAQVGSIDGANGRLNELIILMLRATFGYSTFTWYMENDFNQCDHLLEALYLGTLGPPGYYFSSQPLPLKTSSRNCIEICFPNCIDHSVKAISGMWCKKPSLPLPSSNADTYIVHRILQVKLPTAMELSRRGVKFHGVTFDEAKSCLGSTALPFLRFDEKTSTLYLPEVSVTNVSESGIRNIMAMEISTPLRYDPNPLTQFALFMDELIDSEEDVAVLRKAEVIQGFLESNQQVADLFNSVVKGITGPIVGCKVIDDVRMALQKYTRRKYKILWSEFVTAYFSKPWLVAGSIGAVLLLLMTMAQVFCLFVTCNA